MCGIEEVCEIDMCHPSVKILLLLFYDLIILTLQLPTSFTQNYEEVHIEYEHPLQNSNVN